LTPQTLPMLVFFCSQRSGPARRMESLLAHLARKERTRIRIRRVDVDASPELAARFEITTIPTLVLVRDKQVLGRIEGRASAPRIERLLAESLEPELAAA